MAVRQNGTPYYLHTDHLGSTSVTSAASRNEVGRQTYFAFGSTRTTSGDLHTDYTFTGQKLDADAGLMYYGARYYDWVLGRFISADTLVPDAPTTRLSSLTVNFSSPIFVAELGREYRWSAYRASPSQQMSIGEMPKGLGAVQSFQEPMIRSSLQAKGPDDPQNLNRYAYVRNNPLRYIDPSGYWTFGIGLGGTAGAIVGLSGSVMLVVDWHGNWSVAFSGGGGGYAGIGASGGLVVQGTNADNIYDLNGTVVQTGFSAGPPGFSVGGEVVTQNSPDGPVWGLNINVGPGAQGNGLTPVEFHSMVENTVVVPPGPTWPIDWENYPGPD